MGTRVQLGGLAAALLGAGCSVGLVNPQMPPAGSSPGYSDGYAIGCRAGLFDGGLQYDQLPWVGDRARLAGEPEYKAGFGAGYRACLEEQRRTPKTSSY